MKELSKKQIIGSDGKTMVWVYDGDVEYSKSKDSVNYKYYRNNDGKRIKTRPYNQYSAMTNRCLYGGAHQERQHTYIDTEMSADFSTFDKWLSWAEKQVGFMCETPNGRIWQMDKDLLCTGNKLYSKDTVCFIPDWLNSVLSSFTIMSFEAKKKALTRTYDELFDCLDERVLESLFKISKFDYSLPKENRMTCEDVKEKEAYDLFIQRLSCLYGKIAQWNDRENIMQSITFIDGYYRVTCVKNGEKASKEKFNNVKDAVIAKLSIKEEIVKEYLDVNSKSEKYFSEKFNKLFFNKLCELSDLKYRVQRGEIKLKQWIQVEV